MKNKFFASLLTLALGFSIVGCTAGTTEPTKEPEKQAETETKPEETKVLKFAALEAGYGADVWKEVIAEFEALKPGVKVELEQSKQIEDIISPKMKAGTFPDVVYLGMGRPKRLPETLLAENAIADISDVFKMKVLGEEKTVEEKLLDSAVGTLITNPLGDDKTYMAPIFYNPTGLFYNKGLFKAKGWEVPTDIDGFVALAEKAQAEGIALMTYPTAGYFDGFLPTVFANAGGTKAVNDMFTYKEGAFTSEAANKAFEVLGKVLSLVEKSTPANANGQNYLKNQQLILDNKALFMPNGNWVIGEMKEAPKSEGFEWGITYVPTVKGGDNYVFTFMEQIWIPEAAEQKELAKEFLTFLYSDKAVALLAKHNAYQPVKGGDKVVAEEMKPFYEFAQTAKGLISGSFQVKSVEGVSIADAVYNAIDSVASGSKTVEEWQKGAEETSAKLREAK